MESRVTTASARWAVLGVVLLFVVDMILPSGAAPWVLAVMGLAIVVLLAILATCWMRGEPIAKGRAVAAGVFAVGLPTSLLYLGTLPDAAIPLAGVGAMVICFVGLVVVGIIGLRSPGRA